MTPVLQLGEPEVDEIIRRLRRVEGQVQGLQRMLAEGRDCADVAQQVAAARAALDRVAIDLIAAGMEKCLRTDAGGTPQARANMARLRKVFLMLR
ncbi:MAG: metal-sensing transcriptional repressor [Armatimonadota bacterium]|nr:metal-sensing transcriptional repressor [Armatimonadota bacterium]